MLYTRLQFAKINTLAAEAFLAFRKEIKGISKWSRFWYQILLYWILRSYDTDDILVQFTVHNCAKY